MPKQRKGRQGNGSSTLGAAVLDRPDTLYALRVTLYPVDAEEAAGAEGEVEDLEVLHIPPRSFLAKSQLDVGVLPGVMGRVEDRRDLKGLVSYWALTVALASYRQGAGVIARMAAEIQTVLELDPPDGQKQEAAEVAGLVRVWVTEALRAAAANVGSPLGPSGGSQDPQDPPDEQKRTGYRVAGHRAAGMLGYGSPEDEQLIDQQERSQAAAEALAAQRKGRKYVGGYAGPLGTD